MTHYDELIQQVDIIEVIQKYVPLKPKGDSYGACCPFHDESTPSFSVSPKLGIFKCFSVGCEEAGNVIHFVSKIEGIDYYQAFIKLCREYELEHLINQDYKHILKLYKINAQIAQLYHSNLRDPKKYPKAIGYLRDREINYKIAKTFNLGYAPPDKYFLQRNGFPDELLDDLQLLKSSKKSPKREHFYNRVIIPFYSHNNIVGFSGRTIEDAIPKYLNTKESDIFKKKNLLFGWHQNQKVIRSRKEVVVVEGQFDVITLYVNKINYSIAFSGSSLSDTSKSFLLKQINSLIFFADGDEAGAKAVFKFLKQFINSPIEITILYCQEEDPDSLIQKISWREIKHNYSYRPIEFIYEVLGLDRAINLISFIQDPFRQSKELKKLADLTGKQEFQLEKLIQQPITRQGIKPIQETKSLHPFDKLLFLSLHKSLKLTKHHKELLLNHIKSKGFKNRHKYVDALKTDPLYAGQLIEVFQKSDKDSFIISLLGYLNHQSTLIQIKELKEEYIRTKSTAILKRIQELNQNISNVK